MITFTVPGTPVPQGSMNSFGKGRMVYRPDLKPWRAKVRNTYAQQAGSQRITGAVHTDMEFVMPRPKNHYGTGANKGTIKDTYRDTHHTKRPDVDKCIRAILDALTLDKGELVGQPRPFDDDARVATVTASKRYVKQGEKPHARITIRPSYVH